MPLVWLTLRVLVGSGTERVCHQTSIEQGEHKQNYASVWSGHLLYCWLHGLILLTL